MIHPLDLMTEAESNELMKKCLDAVKGLLPPGTALWVMFAPMGDRPEGTYGAMYGSNCHVEDSVRILTETADRIGMRERKIG